MRWIGVDWRQWRWRWRRSRRWCRRGDAVCDSTAARLAAAGEGGGGGGGGSSDAGRAIVAVGADLAITKFGSGPAVVAGIIS